MIPDAGFPCSACFDILMISFFSYLYSLIYIFYILQAIYVHFLFSHKAERQAWQQQLDQPLSQHGEDGVKMKAILVLCLNSTLVGIYQLTPKSNTGIEVKQFIVSVLMLEFIQWKLALKRYEKQKIELTFCTVLHQWISEW